MAVRFKTPDSAALLKKFKVAVEQTESVGKITTWTPSDDKNYYTHKSTQWQYEAWLKPVAETSQLLAFYIIKSKQSTVSVEAYGFYHGHIIETFLNHFEADFSEAVASPYPVAGDIVA